MKYKFILLVSVGLVLTINAFSEERSYIVPESVAGVKQPFISLNGGWQFRFSPESKWTDIQVPGEAAMQGYAIEHDKPFRYKKSFTLPADYRGKTVILRFDGVYSHARLWVNGVYVREHFGGFTRWETDITSLAKPGKKNEIELEVTDRLDDISYESGYAHHPIGGILRDVTVFALLAMYVFDFQIETLLDADYRDATLRVSCSSDASVQGDAVGFTLLSPDGKEIPLQDSRLNLSEGVSVKDFTIKEPLKWDAEHPNLYTLTAVVYSNGAEVYRFSRKAGFREVKIVKNQLLVNGKPVKLRGACRHDVHPTLGRMTTKEIDSLDAVLFKQANMNFVRTSHYPCTERFVEYCDRLGIYVESESAVCFVTTHRQPNYDPANTQDSAEYASWYLTQFKEMVNTFRSHPSVLFWSLGNESVYGSNFQQCKDWVKTSDTTRPTIFSYPGQQKNEEPIYDILSMHYPYIDGSMSQYEKTTIRFGTGGMPALFDEWAHVPCYTYATLRDDPNIREFWGQSLDMMWSNLFEAQGGLGGAIWGYADETFMLPAPKVGTPWWQTFCKRAGEEYTGNCVGYGEWGIIDVWRRLKPEFWSTKKAYSPVRLLTERLETFAAGEPLLLPVYNRFDHTVLNEITAHYTYQNDEKTLQLPATAPHQKGLLTVPAENWQDGDRIIISFSDRSGEVIDIYTVTLGEEKKRIFPQTLIYAPLQTEETADRLLVKGNNFEIPFDKATGLITNAVTHGETIIEKGPFLNLDVNRKTLNETDWQKSTFAWKQVGDMIEVYLSGVYKDVKADFTIRIFSDGRLQTDYIASGEPHGQLREAGLKFLLPPSVGRLQWERKPYWSYYPDDSFAGPEGDIDLYASRQSAYGEKPQQAWHLDTRNYYYSGNEGTDCVRPLTQQAKGMKENCYRYVLATAKGSVSALSADASIACRINKTGNEQLVWYVNNRWDYPEIAWGNYSRQLDPSPCYGRITVSIK